MTIWVVVAVGPRETYLPNLLQRLSRHAGRIVFVNNHQPYTRFDGVHHLEDFGTFNIYRWWNTGIRYASAHGATHVAILNDDVDFHEDFVEQMHAHLIHHRLAVVDTDRSANDGGAAWMLDIASGLRLDEGYRWWYGDTDLFDRARQQGRFGKFTADYFRHFEPDGHLKEDPRLRELVAADKARYDRRRRGWRRLLADTPLRRLT